MINIITGLPRSGSTLLCNILNQNPKFWASSTSLLPRLCGGLVHAWSSSIELKGDLQVDKQGTEERLKRSLKSFCLSWYEDFKDKVVFDKSRGWVHHALIFRSIFPESKIIVTIRDLKEVFASVEKQHLKSPFLDDSTTPNAKTIMQRAKVMFAQNGLIGAPLDGLYDMINRRVEMFVVRYENLVDRPKTVISEIYDYLEEDIFEHDFENIKNTATDPDAFYLNKFPHEGSGKVIAGPIDGWKNYVPNVVTQHISKTHGFFNHFFNYK